jgi:hypothetical protein
VKARSRYPPSATYKIDPENNEVVLKITSDFRGSEGSIGIGEGAVWILTAEDHNKTLARYNSSSGKMEASIALPAPCAGVIVDFGSVWVTAMTKGFLYRVDPQTNTIASTVTIESGARFSHLPKTRYGCSTIAMGLCAGLTPAAVTCVLQFPRWLSATAAT